MTIPVTVISSSLHTRIDVEYYDDCVFSKDFMQVVGGETENDGKILDINKGHLGKYFYLVPKWTTDPSQAADQIQVTVGGSDLGGKDLAKGAGSAVGWSAVSHP
ncbi:hypothetical protein FGB62_237g01 [Gracilaria domingensis]|nr:hypothetical protein FGB62_237g01 [Gracilaria domingensis]